jgi:hypothetical protein
VNINAAAPGGCYGPLGVKIVPKDVQIDFWIKTHNINVQIVENNV